MRSKIPRNILGMICIFIALFILVVGAVAVFTAATWLEAIKLSLGVSLYLAVVIGIVSIGFYLLK